MRSILLIPVVFFLTSFSALPSFPFNPTAKQQIIHCIQSTEFSKLTLDCPFNGVDYPITMIHNPKRKALLGDEDTSPTYSKFIIVADLPFDLASDLTKWFFKFFKEEDCFIELKGHFSAEEIKQLQPVHVAENVDDPHYKARAIEIFTSDQFINEVFCYYLDGEYYKVRILYNPQKSHYFAKKQYYLEENNYPTTHEIYWNYKYGIITNKKAPQKLIDYLSSYIPASYWDWCFNLQIENGSYVQYVERGYNIETYYSLDTWFDYTRDLLPNS
jgi:hypothetical protein